ncbi:MAG: 4'-phosphopantetheinyl transferase superfamily protein [Oscillospiraceae bacterium]|nr:4'-phosphopantetheinyl transferase superfamily protein [Oscillospiraceae bacterium]
MLFICENAKNAEWRKNAPGISDEKKVSAAFAKKCICEFIGEKEEGIEIKIEKNDYGKPYVRKICKENKKIEFPVHFSLSHSENMIICAVAGLEIGADCQKKKQKNINVIKKLAKRYFAQEEKVFLDSKEKEEDYINGFYSIWAKKEAYVKYTGKGLAEGLGTFSVTSETAQKNYLGEARFEKIFSGKEDFCIYLCYNKKNKNKSEIKYLD